MDLQRALKKFSTTEILSWDSSESDWLPTELCGSLQVFDRFITERTFGQKKRILIVAGDSRIEDEVTVVRLKGSEESFILEKFNEDVRYEVVYGYSYLLHEAPYYVDICKTTTTANAAGVPTGTGEEVLESTWVDISRFTNVSSRLFPESEISIVNMSFPRDSLVTTDHYVKTATGEKYNVDEIFFSLDLISAKGKRVPA